jgi:hypothetical protein
MNAPRSFSRIRLQAAPPSPYPPPPPTPPLLLPRSHHHRASPAIPRFALGRITTEFLFKKFNRWVRGPGPNVHFFARSSFNHRLAFWFSRGCVGSAAAAFSMLSAFNTHWRIPFVQRASRPWQRCSRLPNTHIHQADHHLSCGHTCNIAFIYFGCTGLAPPASFGSREPE